jgi:hypothetical protein
MEFDGRCSFVASAKDIDIMHLSHHAATTFNLFRETLDAILESIISVANGRKDSSTVTLIAYNGSKRFSALLCVVGEHVYRQSLRRSRAHRTCAVI